MRLGSPSPSGVVLIRNKAICIPDSVSMQFLIICLMDLVHASTALHCCGDGMMMILLALSDIIFLGKSHSEKEKKTILHVSIRLSPDWFSTS